MSADLVHVHTIPVYNGLTPEQSWAHIVLADGDEIPAEVSRGKLEGWANIGVWQNSQGDQFAAPLDMESDQPVGILPGYEVEAT